MEQVSVKLSQRAVTGKKVKALRREGIVPVHFYGRGTEPLALQVEAGVLRRLLPRVGRSVPLTVEVEGRSDQNICFIREVQRHPVTEDLLHVDFVRVEATQMVTADVHVILSGDPPGVLDLGGTLVQPLQALQIESLPMNMPASIELDVSGLDDFEKSLRVSDIPTSPEVTILNDPEEMIARVQPPRVEEEEPGVAEEEEVEGEEVEAAEGAEEAEAGEDAAPERRAR